MPKHHITAIEHVTPVALSVTIYHDVAELQLGFEIGFGAAHGHQSIELTSAMFGELLAEIAYAGSKVGRDYEYELMAMVARGADRARTERPT